MMRVTAWLAEHWGALLALPATGGVSVVVAKVYERWLDHRRDKRKQTDEVALDLVERLTSRLDTVEKAAENERRLCDANMAVLRHRINNLAGNFDGLLLGLELAPDKVEVFVTRFKERRAAQELAEATERAAIMASILGATTPPRAPE